MYTATFHKGYLLLSWEYRRLKLFLLHKYLTQALWNIVRPLAESYELMHAHARTMMTLSQVSLIGRAHTTGENGKWGKTKQRSENQVAFNSVLGLF
jgi:hypothetical protein